MSKVESKSDAMNRIFEEYGLNKAEDTFKHKHYTIITRSGIDKIQAKANIVITYNLVHVQRTQAGLDVAVQALATLNDSKIETFGEASPENTQQNYPFAMAEKRAMSRAVLKLAGLYQHGVMSEDESDDFTRKSDPPVKKPDIQEPDLKSEVAGLGEISRDQYEKTFKLLTTATPEQVEKTSKWLENFVDNDVKRNLTKVVENKKAKQQ